MDFSSLDNSNFSDEKSPFRDTTTPRELPPKSLPSSSNHTSLSPSPNIQPTEASSKKSDISLLPTSPVFQELAVPYRFNIMLLLYTQGSLGFTSLKKILHITAGNLDHHLKKLKQLGWTRESTIFSYRPLLQINITEQGNVIFRQYIDHLKSLLHSVH